MAKFEYIFLISSTYNTFAINLNMFDDMSSTVDQLETWLIYDLLIYLACSCCVCLRQSLSLMNYSHSAVEPLLLETQEDAS